MIDIISMIIQAVQYDFILKALVVGSLIAVCCSFLGVFIVLKKQAMIGDGLAHVSFASIAIALLLGQSPLIVSIPIVILASFFILKLEACKMVYADAAIGLISSFSVAVGVMISSINSGFNVDLFSYLFGSILVISDIDVILSIALSIVVIIIVLYYYYPLFMVTYDEEFAKAVGMNTKHANYLICVLVSITIVLGIRVVGTMLISSMIIFPTVTALQIAKSFKEAITVATIISIVSVVLGVFISFIYNLPTGATIVIFNGIAFGLVFLGKKRR